MKSVLLAAGLAALAATAAAAQAPPSPPAHARMDANADSKVTWAEFESAAMARFARRDANKDGVLSADEVHMGPHGGPPGGPPGGAPGDAPPPPPPGAGPGPGHPMMGMRPMHRGIGGGIMMKRADLNDDGVVSREEADRAAKRLFAFLDLNGDGVLSGKELPPGPGMGMAPHGPGQGMDGPGAH